MDLNGDGSLDKNEFRQAILDFGLDFDKASIDVLFNEFDVNKDGKLSYEEFIRGVRGDMSQERHALIMKAFKKFDKDGSGVVNINTLKNNYDVSKHPDVISKRKTKEQVMKEFTLSVEASFAVRMGNEKPDGKVTEEEFIEYYQGISAIIDDDQ